MGSQRVGHDWTTKHIQWMSLSWILEVRFWYSERSGIQPFWQQDLHWDYLMLHHTFVNFLRNLLSIVSEPGATLTGIISTVPRQLTIIHIMFTMVLSSHLSTFHLSLPGGSPERYPWDAGNILLGGAWRLCHTAFLNQKWSMISLIKDTKKDPKNLSFL